MAGGQGLPPHTATSMRVPCSPPSDHEHFRGCVLTRTMGQNPLAGGHTLSWARDPTGERLFCKFIGSS